MKGKGNPQPQRKKSRLRWMRAPLFGLLLGGSIALATGWPTFKAHAPWLFSTATRVKQSAVTSARNGERKVVTLWNSWQAADHTTTTPQSAAPQPVTAKVSPTQKPAVAKQIERKPGRESAESAEVRPARSVEATTSTTSEKPPAKEPTIRTAAVVTQEETVPQHKGVYSEVDLKKDLEILRKH